MIKRLSAAVVMTAILVPATAVGASGAKDPITLHVTGVANQTSKATGVFAGSGTATYMGYVTNKGSVLATFIPRRTCSGGFSSFNTETFTDDSGDTLSISSKDVTCPVGPPGRYQGTGHWIVTSGTRRFAGVQGSGTFAGVADFTAESFDFTFTGKITEPQP